MKHERQSREICTSVVFLSTSVVVRLNLSQCHLPRTVSFIICPHRYSPKNCTQRVRIIGMRQTRAQDGSKQAPQTPCDDRRREASMTCTIATDLGPEVQCPLQLHIFSRVRGGGTSDKQGSSRGTIRGYCKDRIRVTSLVPGCPGHDDSPPTSVGV